MLTSKDKWFGVTYKEDKDSVVSELQALIHAEFIRKSYSEIKNKRGGAANQVAFPFAA